MKKFRYQITRVAMVSLLLASWGVGGVNGSAAANFGLARVNPSPNLNSELAQARLGTAKYHEISAALADGYVDIDVFVPMMGYHYLKPSLLDATFDPAKPELLVYATDQQNNRLRLVAVEYAVPTDLSATPPEGFTGDEDVWYKNEEFGLWTLHAWVWFHNSNGMFAEFNPRLP